MPRQQYRRHSLRTQVLTRPDMFISHLNLIERRERVLEGDSFAVRCLDLSGALESLFLEVLMNAADNVERSREEGVPEGVLSVEMDQRVISVTNGGIPIRIERDEGLGGLIPEVIFGQFLTSSNYDDDEQRHTIGRNGVGVKAVNAFSKLFAVEIRDGSRWYRQEWKDNMGEVGPPQIREDVGAPMVRVSYELDFGRFPVQEYGQEYFQLFERHAADVSLTHGIEVTFNGRSHRHTPKTFSRLFGEVENTAVVKGDGYTLILLDTPGRGSLDSFVNGKITRSGGVHVDAVYKSVSAHVLRAVNGGDASKLVDGKKTTRLSVTLADLRKHISFVLICRLDKPAFTGQDKEYLSSPRIRVEIPEGVARRIKRSWGLMKALREDLDEKYKRMVTEKESRRKKAVVRCKELEDANWAGKRKSSLCRLFVTEGLSASGYSVTLLNCLPGKRDVYGSYPLTGKILNTRKASFRKTAVNKRITEIKRVLNLREEVDYEDPKEFSTLRYGGVIIAADADSDGKHIAGLLVSFFENGWPSLLRRGYVSLLRTPIVRVWLGKGNKEVSDLTFFQLHEFEEWKALRGAGRGFVSRYCKGLGSSSKEQTKKDSDRTLLSRMVLDERAHETLDLVFCLNSSHERKRWLRENRSPEPLALRPRAEEHHGKTFRVEQLPITDFLNREMILYSHDHNTRSLPSALDGLREASRKVVWTELCKRGRYHQKNRSRLNLEKSRKVSQLAPDTSAFTDYHHGEGNLEGVVCNLAQSFRGKNNLPLLTEEGNFGSHNRGGADRASGRYIYTRPRKWMDLVFRVEDAPLLELREEREPPFLLATVPLHAINGCEGLGTGFMTFIPNHNPLQVISYLEARCREEEPQEVRPWYRAHDCEFKVVQRVVRRALKRKQGEQERSPEASPAGSPQGEPADSPGEAPPFGGTEEDPLGPDMMETHGSRASFVSFGRFSYDERAQAADITGLPVWVPVNSYMKWLELQVENGVFESFQNRSDDDKAHFVVQGVKEASYSSLRLKKSKTLSSMYLLGEDGFPEKFEDVHHVLDSFFKWRLPFYARRRECVMSGLGEAIRVDGLKIRLIRMVISGEWTPSRKKMKVVEEELESLQIPLEVFKGVALSDFTLEKIESLEERIRKSERALEEMRALTPQGLWLRDLAELREALRGF